MLVLIVILITPVLIAFWCIQFAALMEMSDEEFVGKNDKLIWALAMLLMSFLGAFLFWLCKTPDFDKSSSENHGLTNEEIEKLLGTMDRYKTLIEQFPEYKPFLSLTATMPKSDRENIEKLYIKQTTEKLKRKFYKGPASMAEGAYGILIAELIRREVDMTKL
jgi:hypothetical protein